jgi:hypothetical protein
MIISHLKQTMKSFIRFFDFMGAANMAFPAKLVSLPPNVAANFALGRVV